jgi:hypothetical protein
MNRIGCFLEARQERTRHNVSYGRCGGEVLFSLRAQKETHLRSSLH